MKNFFKVGVMALAMTGFMASCDDDDEKNESKSSSSELLSVSSNFVDNTVIKTYKGLADKCETLMEDLSAMSSQEDLNKVCEDWKSARQYWEWSEAFLFGAASSYGIDPHIDTWPFDAAAFNSNIAKFDPEDENSLNSMSEIIATGQNLTGFHALEYLIFRNGSARSFAELTAKEIAYAQLVSEDLYLSSVRLEASWAGLDKVGAGRKELLEEAEMEPNDDFGEYMREAGNAGSLYRTPLLAVRQIIDGCKDIADEVASAKIGKPTLGEDVNYIESPNAYNSITDFYDNILSCQYALYGGLNATTPAVNSVMSYAQKNCPAQAKACDDALQNALSKVKAMKKPFVVNYNDQTAKDAIEAIKAFDESLSALSDALN